MNKFYRLTGLVEAIQYDETNETNTQLIEWTEGKFKIPDQLINQQCARIDIGHGPVLSVYKGMWIVKNINNQFHIMYPHDFENAYAKIENIPIEEISESVDMNILAATLGITYPIPKPVKLDAYMKLGLTLINTQSDIEVPAKPRLFATGGNVVKLAEVL